MKSSATFRAKRGNPRKRRGGRPAKPQRDVRETLLETARTLFSSRGFAEVNIREIAAAAGVNLAMIPYYFGNKRGLYAAVIEATLDRILEGLRANRALDAGGAESIESFLKLYIGTLTQNPWLPRVIVREVLSEDAEYRERFIKRFASVAVPLVQGVFRAAISDQEFRAELDPVLAMLSLIGMAVFPFLAFPVLGPFLNLKIDPDFRDRLAAHTAKLFLDGARRR